MDFLQPEGPSTPGSPGQSPGPPGERSGPPGERSGPPGEGPGRSLPPEVVADLVRRVEDAASAAARPYPGDPGGRQPVHTVYVAADRFTAGTAAAWGTEARRLLAAHAPDGDALAAGMGLADRALAAEVRERVDAKLAAEPVEDLRIDFEDGYGVRGDAEEDQAAVAAAGQVAEAMAAGTLPPFVGLRVKSFWDGLHHRSIRTLDAFLTGLLDRTQGRLPAGFVVTFPKVMTPDHVAAFAELLGRLEAALGLPAGALRFEVQVETTQSVVGQVGEVALRRIAEAGGPALCGAHFGVYDYTAACGLPPAEQRLDHPACDFARHVMQVALAGTGIRLSDGSTNVVPAGDDTASVHAAWRHHAGTVRHSLRHGFWQGWDMHPAHLPSRFATVYAFHLAGLDEVTGRVHAFVEASRGGGAGGAPAGVLDEPATVRALVARVRRAVHCGALTAADAGARTGLDAEALSV